VVHCDFLKKAIFSLPASYSGSLKLKLSKNPSFTGADTILNVSFLSG